LPKKRKKKKKGKKKEGKRKDKKIWMLEDLPSQSMDGRRIVWRRDPIENWEHQLRHFVAAPELMFYGTEWSQLSLLAVPHDEATTNSTENRNYFEEYVLLNHCSRRKEDSGSILRPQGVLVCGRSESGGKRTTM
jgi:hypothetical protein